MAYFSASIYRSSIDPGDRENEPGVDDPFWGRRLSGARLSTTVAGFGVLSGTYGCDGVAAQRALRWLGRHVVARSCGRVVFEGRVEQVARAADGVRVTCLGYYSSLDDLVFDKTYGKKGHVDVAALGQSIVSGYAPLLSGSDTFVTGTGLALAMGDYDGSESPKQVLEASLDASEDPDPVTYHAAVWDERRLWLVPEERALVSWTIPGRSLDGPIEFARDLRDLVSGVDVVYEQVRKTSTGTTSVRTVEKIADDPDIVAELGFRRRLAVSANKTVDTAAEAKVFGAAQLRQYRTGITAFSLRVGGLVLNHLGTPTPPQLMRAGGLARLGQTPGDEAALDDRYRLFFVAGTDWDVDSGRVTVQCEPIDELPNAAVVLASSGLRKAS